MGEAPAAIPPSNSVDVLFHVLLTLAAVVALGHLLGRLFRRIGQPPVIGEVIAGLALGPSLLGVISPHTMNWFIPPAETDPHGNVTAALETVAQLGVILYMFCIGLELNENKLKDQIRAALVISQVSTFAPFLLGAALAVWLHPTYAPRGVPLTSFSLFLGVALAVTAFPVLARILTDRQIEGTQLGTIAMASAAANDVVAWCLLALVVGIVKSHIGEVFRVAAACLLFIACMLWLVRPRLHAWCHRWDEIAGPFPQHLLIGGLVGVLLCALATQAMGIHAIFGAFLAGAMIPHGSRFAKELRARMGDSAAVLLLPAFFALTGMRTQIGMISGWRNWLTLGMITLVATLGKFVGTALAARLSGIGWRDSAALGVLMNTRGLMELIVLNIGLELGVISPTLFSMMVLMALTTTLATSPLLSLLIKTPASTVRVVEHTE
jgi:Kef-type K+ transport system membrane component KefB